MTKLIKKFLCHLKWYLMHFFKGFKQKIKLDLFLAYSFHFSSMTSTHLHITNMSGCCWDPDSYWVAFAVLYMMVVTEISCYTQNQINYFMTFLLWKKKRKKQWAMQRHGSLPKVALVFFALVLLFLADDHHFG